MKHWAHDYDRCQVCGTTDSKHKGKGLCVTCYYKQYKRQPASRKGDVEKAREEVAALIGNTLATYHLGATVQYAQGQLIIRLARGNIVLDHRF